MKDLAINRNLDEETRKQGIMIGMPGKGGKVYSLHITQGEVIITDNSDYTKIYAVYSLEFWQLLEGQGD